MTQIIVQKNSPRYQVVDTGSFIIDLKEVSNEEFLSLTDYDNFNDLIDRYGKSV